MADNSKRADLGVQARKDQRAEDGRKAMADYEAEAAATRAKTERLRAMRLAREAEMAKNVPAKAAKAKSTAKSTVKSTAKITGKSAGGKKKAAAKPGKTTATLAEWLKARQEDGF